MITVCRKGHQITRNCSLFKPFLGNAHDDSSESDNDIDVRVGEDDARSGAPVATEVGPVEKENIPAAQEKRAVDEPAEDQQERQRRYPQRRRLHPLFYRDGIYVK